MSFAAAGRFRRVLAVGCVVAAVLPLPHAVSASDGYQDAWANYWDVSLGVHGPAILALHASGISHRTDCAPGRLCPDEPLPRWVMAVWMVRAVDSHDPDPPTADRAFGDVDPTVWWAPHVQRLAELRITEGCSTVEVRYCPAGIVTRGQMASFLVRAFGIEPSDPVGFADSAAGVHSQSIDALAAAGITAGCATSPFRYCPEAAVTRGQMAALLARALNLVAPPQNLGLGSLPSPDVGLAGARHIVYGRGDQRVWLVEADGTLFDTYLVSGRETRPDPGRYKVFSKSRHTRAYSGGITMEYMVRFTRLPGSGAAIGFHDIPVDRDGTPLQTEEELGQYRSAGCVRQSEEKAIQLYEWASVGTRVVVLA